MYEMKRRKGDGYVTQTYELNRLDYIILDTLYDGNFRDYYDIMKDISEIYDDFIRCLECLTIILIS